MGKAKKKERKNKKSKQKICTFKHFFIPLHSLLRDKANGDPLAQLVEHNTFNVGVLGSSPKRITENKRRTKQIPDNQILSGISFLGQVAENSRIKHIIGG